MRDNKTTYSNLDRKKTVRKSAVLSKNDTYLGKRPKASFDTPVGKIKGSDVDFALSQIDRENHTHVLGSTGTGKSKFLELLIREDIKNPNAGMCLLDPHGLLYEEVKLYASHKHSRLADRFVFFDPTSDLDHVVGFNPIANGSQKMDTLLDILISAILKPWGQDNPDSSPRISTWLENIFYPLIVNNLTLIESAPLISSEKANPLRSRLLNNVNSHTVLSDWTSFDNSNEQMRKQMIEGASNRIRKFLRNEAVRNVLGQQKHILNFQEIIDEKKILLINLKHTDRLTKPNTRLLGTMIVNEMFRVAMLRDPLDKNLAPFTFYIDEFANFITRDVADSLEQLRKFNVRMVLSHQHLAQLKEQDEYLYSSVMTCCKNKVVFGGLSPEDAELMTKSVATGHLNLKTVKHEQYKVRERHFEETRTVKTHNWSDSNSTGSSRGTSSGENSSQTDTRGQASIDTNSQTQTQSQSNSTNQSRSDSLTDSQGLSEGQSQSKTNTLSQTASQGTSNGEGGSNTTSSQRSNSRGQSESDTLGSSKGSSDSHGGNSSNTHSKSSMRGNSQNRSQTQGQSHSHGNNQSNSSGSGHSDSTGTTQNNSSSNSQHYDSAGFRSSGHNTNRGNGSGSSSSRSQNSFGSSSDGSSENWGQNSSNSQGRTQSESDTSSHGSSTGENWSHSDNHSDSESRTQGRNSSQSQSKGNSQSNTFNSSQSRSEGHSSGESEGLTASQSKNSSQSRGQSNTTGSSETQGNSHAVGSSHADSHSSSHSNAQGRSHGVNESKSNSESHSEGGSTSEVPFVRSEEVTELASTTFWSKEEMMYMTQGEIMNQDVAQAFIKIGSNAPVRCEINEVRDIFYSPKFSPQKIQTFYEKSVKAHPQYYVKKEDAVLEYQDRQRLIFGEPLSFDEYEIVPAEKTKENKKKYTNFND